MAVGKKAYKQKLPDSNVEEKKTIVSRKHPIAIVPRVRVLDGVRIDVPAVVIPVHIHGAKHQRYRTEDHPYHHPPNHDRLNFIRDIEVLQSPVPILVIFLKNIFSLSCKAYPTRLSGKIS